MSRKDTGKSSFKRYYRTSGIGRGELSSICQLTEEGRLHGIIMCGWDTDTETKKMGKVGHVCAIIRPEEAKKVCNTQMRGSRRAALWGISLLHSQAGPLSSCALSTVMSEGLVESWNKDFMLEERGLTCLVFLSLSYTSVPLSWYTKSCCHIVLPMHRLPVSQWTAAGELIPEKASGEPSQKTKEWEGKGTGKFRNGLGYCMFWLFRLCSDCQRIKQWWSALAENLLLEISRQSENPVF